MSVMMEITNDNDDDDCDDDIDHERATMMIDDDNDEHFSHTPPSVVVRRNRIIRRTVALTLLFEGITCFLRFAGGYQSTRDTSALARYTLGLRIHHGYLGIVMAATSYCCCRHHHHRPALYLWCYPIGLALIASDLIHHFLVLWPITGDPQFDLVYPDDR